MSIQESKLHQALNTIAHEIPPEEANGDYIVSMALVRMEASPTNWLEMRNKARDYVRTYLPQYK